MVRRGDGVANTVVITDPGQDYDDSGTVVVTISGGGGTAATATALQSGGAIQSITITAAGQNYESAPTIIITNPGGIGEGATATCELTETKLSFTPPTQLNNITFPNMTGTVAVLDGSGDLSVPGDLSVTGDATISGDLTFGNQTSDTVTFVADVDSSIIPEVSGTYDLGSPTYP